MYPYQQQQQQQPPPPPGQQQQQRYPPPPPGAAGGVGGGGTSFHNMNNAMGQMHISAPPPPQQQFPAYGVPSAGTMQRPGPPPMTMQPPPAATAASTSAFGGVGTATSSTAPPPPMQGVPMFQQPMQQQPPRMMQMQPPPPHPGASATSHVPPPQVPNMRGVSSSAAASVPGMMDPMQQMQPHQVDTDIHCPPRFFALTSDCIPQHMGMVQNSKVPLGGLIRPLARTVSNDADENEVVEEEPVDVVQPTAAGIVRCKKCRLYINPFVQWLDSGRRWCCNICAAMNETPSAYFCHLEHGVTGDRRDKYERPELCKGIVEYVAPSEYMVRPPQPPAYFFVIDVSATAAQCGVLVDVANGIRESLDNLPGGRRVQVGFITFDRSVHYYSLKSGLSSAQMMVVPDLQNLFVPAPDDLLVNLADSREVVDSFLENLPTMFQKNAAALGNPMDGSALGPALKAAYTVIKHMGGKMIVCQSTLPTLGAGNLDAKRENPRLIGTPDEVTLLKPSLSWYKDTAVEFSKAQICVDMFLFPQAYIDAANLEQLASITGGNLHTFVAYNSVVDGPKFRSTLGHTLIRDTALESVMRIRCSRGMRVSNFYGNFYIRGTDLLSLPNCTEDSSFGFDLTHEDNAPLTCSYLTIQSALLYTTCGGERRIRVCTEAVRVTQFSGEYLAGLNVPVSVALLGKQAMTLGLRSGLEQARNRLQTTCIDIVKAAKHHQAQQQQPNDDADALPSNLSLLPLYILALIKNITLRGGTDVHPDERVQAIHTLNGLWWEELEQRLHPDLYELTLSNSTWGNPEPGSRHIVLPNKVNLSIERLNSNGIYLLDDGQSFTLWIGNGVSNTNVAVLNDLFGISDEFHDVNVNVQAILMERLQDASVCESNELCGRLARLTAHLRLERGDNGVKVVAVREGIDEWLEGRLYWRLIEDRANFAGVGMLSYAEFMQMVISQGQMGPPGAPSARSGMPQPPGPPGTRPPAQNSMMSGGGGTGGPVPPPPHPGMIIPGRAHGGPPPPPQQLGGARNIPPPPQLGTLGGAGAPPAVPVHPPNVSMPPAPSSYGAQPSASVTETAPPPQRNIPMPPAPSSFSATQRHAPPPPMNSHSNVAPPPVQHAPPRSFGSAPPPPQGMSQQHQQPPPPAQHYQQPPPPQHQQKRSVPPPPPPGPPNSFGAPPPGPPRY